MTKERFLEKMDLIVKMAESKGCVKTSRGPNSYEIGKVSFDIFENNSLNLRLRNLVIFIDIQDIEHFDFTFRSTRSFVPKEINIYLRFENGGNDINIESLKIK